MSHTVGSKGQVVIAKTIREQLGIEQGWMTIQRLVNDHVEIYFIPPKHDRSLKGCLAQHVNQSILDPSLRRTRTKAWSAIIENPLDESEL
ncbi:MAG: AbrB/MazE/SpoVT family DNA-binding domain-containing protein [Candidatus Competibacteraceae bacterium]|jgi:bifunctional DNA-binding transcriptional regulator/antitoxin component of YhaV-PrlF toxin-antitoxin module|nr:AbrB/MazE/SpoVT family DNA-binding domain-containing protein [Candidatus Competibacteraceae bacterium]